MQQLPDCFYRVSVKALILNETRDKFLVCKEDNGWWELPGGGLDWGMTPQGELSREIREEMGLQTTYVAKNPSYFLTGKNTLGKDFMIANVIYECEVASLNFTPSDECVDIKFIDKSDIEEMQLFNEPKQLAEMFDPARHSR